MEYFILYLLILFIPIIASLKVRSSYAKYKAVKNEKKLSGCEVALKILEKNGLSNVYVVENPGGELSDCYDSSRKTVRLSPDVFHGETVAAMAIAAHECGHAIQDKEKYTWMVVRSSIYPVINLGTKISYILFFIGLFLEFFDLIYISIGIVLLGLIFQLVTLPVEFDASKRARRELDDLGIVNATESKGVDNVLSSAAMTYVAGVLSSLLNLLRLIMAANDRRR